MPSNCSNCPMRAKYEKNPKSLLGRLWRWHINFCLGWKTYFKSLSTQQQEELKKKYIILSCFILLFTGAPIALSAHTRQLENQLKEIAKSKKAEIGIALILNGKDTITVHNSKKYPMLSVFKFHQALAVADYITQHKLSLKQQLFIDSTDLKKDIYSPLRDKYPKGNFTISFADLLTYTLQLSDNNACDILFKHTGGPKATDLYIRSLGIQNFAIAFTEEDMHQNINTCYKNYTTPLETVKLLEVFLTKNLFTDSIQYFIRNTMIECSTGKDRLPQPLLGTKAVIGHKTGSGDRNSKGERIATNDIGFVILPDGRYYTLAVFIKDSKESDEVNAAIIASISHTVYHYMNKTKRL